MITNLNFTNSLSEEIYRLKYQLHFDKGLKDTFARNAKALAEIEEDSKVAYWKERFEFMLSDFKVIPGGRIVSNAGSGLKGTTLINCFVDGFDGEDQDSMEGIFAALRRQGLILKSEGGYGFCVDILRPRGAFISGIAAESPGPVEMLNMWDTQSNVITKGSGRKKQDKRVKKGIRKGAQMVTMSCWHPSIIEFITAKQQPGVLTKFNMSVNITDGFITAVMKDKSWILEFPDYEKHKADYKKFWDGNLNKWKSLGFSTKIYQKFEKASELWDIIMTSTYNRNEPGVLFVDRINSKNNLWHCEFIHATNPCGEQLLPKFGSCLLTSLNLTKFINETLDGWNYDLLRLLIPTIVRFMDNVIELTHYPLPEQEKEAKSKRRIGLGVMGYGSALMLMQIPYGSEKALILTHELMNFLVNEAYSASSDLAVEKGSFPLFSDSDVFKENYLASEFIKRVLRPDVIQKIKNQGIRNSHLLSIQPTGHTAILANNVSGGLEPVFLPEYNRTFILDIPPEKLEVPVINWEGKKITKGKANGWGWVKEGDEDIVVNHFTDGILYKFDKNRGLTKTLLIEDYAVKILKEKGIWDEKMDWAATTDKLTIANHIDTMAVFAKYIDSSMSKTVNLPNNYPYEDFKKVYLTAWETGTIKGVATYRAGTMTAVLSAVKTNSNHNGNSVPDILEDVNAPKRPKVLEGEVIRFINDKEEWIAVVGLLNKRPYELFTGKADGFVLPPYVTKGFVIRTKIREKTRYDFKFLDPTGYPVIIEGLSRSFNPEFWNYAKLISGVLRHGMPIQHVVEMIKSLDLKEDTLNTWKAGVTRIMKRYIPDNIPLKRNICPSCKEPQLIYAEGCVKCMNCTYSECS